MTISQNGVDFIKNHEGFMATAYQDSANVWTIGYGTIVYKNGQKVKEGDTITLQQAIDELTYELQTKAIAVFHFTENVPLNQNQFDALCSFAYNEGLGALAGSTLLRKVKSNPSDPSIRDAFLMWIKAGGQINNGLKNRRKDEADLYFTPIS